MKTIWNNKISKEKRLKCHHRPSNCKTLKTPKVNPEIVHNIKQQARAKDVKLQKIQSSLIKGVVPVIKSIDIITKFKPNQKLSEETIKQLKAHATDSIGLLSIANHDLLQSRRDGIILQLAKDYRQLRSDVPAESKYLFGDDLKQRLTTIKATNKARNST